MSESDNQVADLLAIVLSGRADPLVDVGLTDAPAAVRAELAVVREALASLALAGPPPLCPRRSYAPAFCGRLRSGWRPPPRPPRDRYAKRSSDAWRTSGSASRSRHRPGARGARLDAARAERTPVVYVVDEHEPSDSDLDAWGAHNMKGTHGAQVWAPLAPKPGDCVVAKPTYSAFNRSNLAEVLAELGVDTLVLAGCLTEVGLLVTATDALQRGYAVEVPVETQAGATAQTEQAALNILGLLPPYGPARDALLRATQAPHA